MTVYEALAPCTAELPSNRPPSRASWVPLDGSTDLDNAPQAFQSLQEPYSHLPTPLIGAELIMNQVYRVLVS